MPAMNFSTYQQNIFNEIETQTGNIIIQAVAGSGKTTTLIECMKRSKGKSIFVAFSKAIQTELATRVPSHITSSTLHSVGLKTIIKNLGYTKVDTKKLSYLMQQYPATSFLPGMTNLDKVKVFQLRSQITSLISNWKNTLIDFNNNEEVAKAANYYNINYEPENLGTARSIMAKSIQTTKYIDFDDMIYFPVAMNLKTETYDNLFIDECQDLNRTQIEFILKLMKQPNGRIIAVGDKFQSIFGFRGADTNAMNRIKEVLNAKELPLSVCYRCPTSHIDLAKSIFPNIEPSPSASQGSIQYINEPTFFNTIDTSENPLIICRTNAPLISFALQLLKLGKKVHVKGSDICHYLCNLIENFKANSIPELQSKVDEWENNQLESLNKRKASLAVKNTIIDYADVIREFALNNTSVNTLIASIQSIFSESNEGTVLSSCHKAKGLEADSVYIIRPDLLPLIHKNQQPWEVEQETNLQYVAYTRSKNKLTFVNHK
jgi:superfamily I DNA/RNA helicase